MLSEHRHSGKLLPHHHTSYAGLLFLLILTAVLITGFSLPSQADSVISARISGPAPTEGATIYDPANNQSFTSSPVLVSGHCPDNTYVKINRNNVLAGSLVCPASHNFSLSIDLIPGTNIIQAQDYDFLDQPGPVTPAVTITYSPAVPVSTPSSQPVNPAPDQPIPKVISIAPLVITSDTAIAKNLTLNQSSAWQIKLSGGHNPYAINWEWGDGSTDMYSLASAGTFTATHTYRKAGAFTIRIHASDSSGTQAYLQLAAVVNGITTPSGSTASDGSLTIAWPLWVVAALMIGSFWLGDKYKQRRPAHIPPLPTASY